MSPTDKTLWIPKPWGGRLNSVSVEVGLAAWEGGVSTKIDSRFLDSIRGSLKSMSQFLANLE